MHHYRQNFVIISVAPPTNEAQ